jgi:hypothetical protein
MEKRIRGSFGFYSSVGKAVRNFSGIVIGFFLVEKFPKKHVAKIEGWKLCKIGASWPEVSKQIFPRATWPHIAI